MPASGRTPNLGLGTYVGSDTTSWLQDFNRNMNILDTNVGDAVTQISAISAIATNAENIAENAQSVANSALSNADVAQTTANTALMLAEENESNITELTESVEVLDANALNELLVLPTMGWVENTSDARYPYSLTIVSTIPHNNPYAIAYGGDALLPSDVQAFATTIQQFIYDNVNNTITFYSTMADSAQAVEVTMSVRG